VARDLIVSKGYQPRDRLDQTREATFVRSHRAFTLDRTDGSGEVDLQWRLAAHWQIRPSFQLDLECLWERREPFSFAGTTVPNPSPEDLLLILCIHGSCHRWVELRLVCDIAELVRRYPGLDWEWIMARARALGTVRMLFLGLRLAYDLLDAPLPDKVADAVLMDQAVGRLVVQVREWLFSQQRPATHLFEEATFFVRTGDGPWDRLRYALFYFWAYVRPGLIPTVEDRALLPLPKHLAFLYYLIKPVQMVVRHGFRPLGRGLENLCRQLWDQGQV
jgi:hypothetical protein